MMPLILNSCYITYMRVVAILGVRNDGKAYKTKSSHYEHNLVNNYEESGSSSRTGEFIA